MANELGNNCSSEKNPSCESKTRANKDEVLEKEKKRVGTDTGTSLVTYVTATGTYEIN